MVSRGQSLDEQCTLETCQKVIAGVPDCAVIIIIDDTTPFDQHVKRPCSVLIVKIEVHAGYLGRYVILLAR